MEPALNSHVQKVPQHDLMLWQSVKDREERAQRGEEGGRKGGGGGGGGERGLLHTCAIHDTHMHTPAHKYKCTHTNTLMHTVLQA